VLGVFDWVMVFSILPIVVAGFATISSFGTENELFHKQIVWLGFSLFVFLLFSFIDWRFLRETRVVVGIFFTTVVLLLLLFIFATVTQGARSWFDLGSFSFQPSDPAKLILILILAKYFSRRHIEIANFRHILVSGLYAFILFVLVLLQPDFGSAIIMFLIWLGMILVSGISKKHLFLVFAVGILTFAGLWSFAFKEYQKDRVRTFLNPLADIHGAGYNAFQSTVAVGSGGFLGKGFGYGTQSRLKFLPEYETDFVFAAFAEEWGFVGVTILFISYGIFIWRVILYGRFGATNFESLFCLGYAFFIMSHITIHVGINIGLLPVTGTTLPLMSYGGSHLVTVFAGLGIINGMRRYARSDLRVISEKEVPIIS